MSESANTSALRSRLLSGKLYEQQSVYALLALADKPSMHLEKTNEFIIEKYENIPIFKSNAIEVGGVKRFWHMERNSKSTFQ